MGLRWDQSTDTLSEKHEINVTPFIDVMLVLLIIFMVAAPLATATIPVELPATSAAPRATLEKPVYLTVKPDLQLVLGETVIPTDGLEAALLQATDGHRDSRIYLRADKTLRYGDLVSVMDKLREAGFLKVALVGLDRGGAAP